MCVHKGIESLSSQGAMVGHCSWEQRANEDLSFYLHVLLKSLLQSFL